MCCPNTFSDPSKRGPMSGHTFRHGSYLKYLCGIIAHISQMVDSYILKFNNATLLTLRAVAPATNNYFDLNVATYKKVWTNFELGIFLNDSYGNK